MTTQTETNTQTKWVLDPAHSELTFKVKHLMISNVKGSFNQFSAETNGDDLFNSTVHVTIDAASIDTNDAGRDGHLKSADFFDVENHPTLTFKSTLLEKKDDENFILHGHLTIKGITHAVELNAEFGGMNADPWGNQKAGFSISGKIDRKRWDLNWNAALETGGVLVSDEVKIAAEVQFVKK